MTDTAKLLNRVRLRVERSEQIEADDIEALFGVSDLPALARLARTVRERRHGRAAYIRNAVRVEVAPHGAIAEESVSAGESAPLLVLHDAGTRTLDEWVGRLREEMGRHPDAVASPSASFIDAVAECSSLGVDAVLDRLAALLPVIPDGAGAELLDAEWRGTHAPAAISAERWIAVHRAAHRLGLKSIAAMAHGTQEHPRAATRHLLRIRELQEEGGGFVAFAPMAIHNRAAAAFYLAAPTAIQSLRSATIARLVLDTVPHILTAPALVGLEIAAVALSYGADTVDATISASDVLAEEFPVGNTGDLLPVVDTVTTTARRQAPLDRVRARVEEARFVPTLLDARFGTEVAVRQ